MSQATCWTKKIEEKNFIFFSLFIGGTLMIFQEDFLWDFFRKIVRVPPMKNEKNLKFFFFNFFYPTCSLGHPKMFVRNFFEKSLTNFECVLFVRPRILTTSPFFCSFCKNFAHFLQNFWNIFPKKEWKYVSPISHFTASSRK